MDFRLQSDPDDTVIADHIKEVSLPAVELRPRLDAIDFLRGLVMVIMVLDHARDYLGGSSMDPRDVHDPALFLTRWVTHFCAPVFVMLAGVSAYLYGARGRTPRELSWFLFTRGLWLILIELTLVRFAFTFDPNYDFVFMQVIWVIGCSMLALSALVYLPRWVIGVFGLVLIAGHNLLDGIQAESLGRLSTAWVVLHQPGMLDVANTQVLALYSIVPWIGVMAAGYALGPVFHLGVWQRWSTLLRLGLAVTAGFVVLRALNVYGDPTPWQVQDDAFATVLSFINCEKYPPSLAYLTMTLGPALIVLALFSGAQSALARAIVTIGRVPFLFYVAHIFVVHGFAIGVAAALGFEMGWLFDAMPVFAKPEGYGLSLPAIYSMWIVALLMLYPLCKAFARIKQTRKDWWLSYL